MNTGWAAGVLGKITKTTNGGNNWSIQNSGINYIFRGLWFVDNNTGWAVGQHGTILKTTTGGDPIGIKPISNEVPAEYSLHQNYPNPFNPSTLIEFDVPKVSFVKLTVYDILGNEISSLLKEELKAGSYRIKWNASLYTSGVYFYKLVAEGYTETRKMVFMK